MGNQSNFYNLWHKDREKASDRIHMLRTKQIWRGSSLRTVSSQLHNRVVTLNLENVAILSQD